MCTADGTLFDIVNIVPYLQKYHRHPVTGDPLTVGELIRLHVHRNAENELACPITGKVFTDFTAIVAVKTSGYVYAREAIDELNIKAKNWRDLVTDEPFTRRDIITLQDPLAERRKMCDFAHLKEGLKVWEEGATGPGGPASSNLNLGALSGDQKRVLQAMGASVEGTGATGGGPGSRNAEEKRAAAWAVLDREKAIASTGPGSSGARGKTSGGTQPPPKKSTTTSAVVAAAAAAHQNPTAGLSKDWRLQAPAKENTSLAWRAGAATWNSDVGAGPQATPGMSARLRGLLQTKRPGYLEYVKSHETTGAVSKSITSTAFTVSSVDSRTMTRRQRTTKEKGYVRLHTNLGDLNLELHCDTAPRTCENFLTLCDVGYYDGTVFHRSIRNFMIQGGDPTGTGKGGESIYGPTFKDELGGKYKHEGKGVLSMANAGKDTNGSQFFITYKSAPSLDGKHTVFGRVVGGFDVLVEMERTPTDEGDRPTREVRITGVDVFTDPFQAQEKAERRAAEEKLAEEVAQKEGSVKGTWFSTGGAARTGISAPGGGGGGALAAAAVAVREVTPSDLGKRGAEDGGGGGGSDSGGGGSGARKKRAYGNFDAW